jgi:uridine phosphorylase
MIASQVVRRWSGVRSVLSRPSHRPTAITPCAISWCAVVGTPLVWTIADAPDAPLLARVEQTGRALPGIALHRGATWTTDAPYRETESAIAQARQLGALAVEMEAAALYAFSAMSGHSIVCFAHVTNSMAQTEGDFEKGEADGAKATLAVVAATVRAWRT